MFSTVTFAEAICLPPGEKLDDFDINAVKANFYKEASKKEVDSLIHSITGEKSKTYSYANVRFGPFELEESTCLIMEKYLVRAATGAWEESPKEVAPEWVSVKPSGKGCKTVDIESYVIANGVTGSEVKKILNDLGKILPKARRLMRQDTQGRWLAKQSNLRVQKIEVSNREPESDAGYVLTLNSGSRCASSVLIKIIHKENELKVELYGYRVV